ncbi:ecotin [Phenylobacterium sp. Root77]|uniref:serine protease inhibitor ecotin n=1 Tax=unclassified Phenylobacterium TaxID=2640670 RepID=UPI0006F64C22|nr:MULTISPECIES: serine protease inhibitor ecotin [unclassified Phenylobacterium]KQW71720.1 ecotin [Phenylobacterium sp. Root1277]KQW94640.1 ecotin [Phenylobacterium sp. Root1290]KRC44333.1 ecotin [Phenylobacterium sp. Root77]
MALSSSVRPRLGWRLSACSLVAALAAGEAQAQPRPPRDELQAFPQAGPGQVRRIIRLPAERDENALRVGLVVGRTMWVDCNRQMFSARIEERTAEGWGYTYYVVTSAGPPASTMMACPTNARSQQFVRSADEPLLRYNSRLPLVVFAPNDVEIRYRSWRAGPEVTAR